MPNRDFSNVPAGPGAVEQSGESPLPLLEGSTDYEVVELHNPLSVEFRGVVGITRPVNVPFEVRTDGMTSTTTRTAEDVSRNYGLPLKNPDHPAKGHIQQTISIPAGATIRLQGAQAQVIVRQLVNEIMSREGQQLLMADAYARNQIEKRVVMRRSSIQDIMDAPLDIPTQITNAVSKLNEDKPSEEQAFGGRTATPDDPRAGNQTPEPQNVGTSDAKKSGRPAR